MLSISIVVVNWNTKDLLVKCLEALLPLLEMELYEVIVVDNGSSDGSQEAVRSVFPFVKLIDTRANLGYAKACNIGIRASRARYLCVLNSDVVVREGCLETLLSYMDNHPEVAIAGPLILNSDLSVQDTCRKLPTVWNNICQVIGLNRVFPKSDLFSGEHMMFFEHDRELYVDGLAGCFMVVRRRAIDDVGLMDEQFFLYCEETDWSKRFRDAGWLIAFCPQATAIHVHGASSSLDPIRFSKEQVVSRLKYWKKHHSLPAAFAFRAIHCVGLCRKILVEIIRSLLGKVSAGQVRQESKSACEMIILLVFGGW